jgi:hypothetical protein
MKTIILLALFFISCASPKKQNSDTIGKLMEENVPEMQECYLKVLEKSSKKFNFEPIVELTINDKGKAKNIHFVLEKGKKNRKTIKISKCMRSVIRKIDFPPSAEEGLSQIKQLFSFTSEL